MREKSENWCRMGRKIKLLLLSARPKQWTKNLVIFAAIIFSGKLFDVGLLFKTGVAFFSLCMLSGFIYILNDILDIEKDRHHPKKKNRPIASGEISINQAFFAGFLFFLLAFLLGTVAGGGYLVAAGIYLLLQIAYSEFLKHVVILDIITIAAGFVIRAVAGVWTIGVPLSPWLLVCAALLALFLAAAKRRHELLLLGEVSDNHRPVLSEYSMTLLDEITSTLSAATITTYSLYTFFSHAERGGYMMLTIPFVLYGVLRYQYLIHTKNEGGSPEDVLLKDKPTVINIFLWILSVIVILYYHL